MLSDAYYLIGSFADMNSDPTEIADGIDSFFHDSKYFKSIELGWTKSQGQIYVDNMHVTLWHADESKKQGSSKGYGSNFSASRLIDGQVAAFCSCWLLARCWHLNGKINQYRLWLLWFRW